MPQSDISQANFTIDVTGAVTVPLVETAASLSMLPQTTITADGFTYVGVSVGSLLAQAGLEYPAVKNGQLHDYILVSGGQGASAVLSEGEIDPAFGGASSTDIVATSLNGDVLGTPMLVAPGDVDGNLDVFGVTSLYVGEAAVAPVTNTAVPTTSFTITGVVQNPGTYTVQTIEQMETIGELSSVTQHDTFFAGASSETFAFTGPSLFDLILTADPALPPAQGNRLDDYVAVTGSDGYSVVYSMGEIVNQDGPVPLLAIDDGLGTYPSISGTAGDFRSTAPFDGKGGRYVSNVENIEVFYAVACFRAGTRITTREGALPIERLRVGMRVVTPGGSRPITWIGHRRLDPARHPRPEQVLPVCILAGAFGPQLPERDLHLSPDHAIFWEGVLIPVRHLVNGSTIAQTRQLQPVTYWHVELDSHDVLLAEGLAAESYLATDQGSFAEGGPVVTLHPGEPLRIWEAHGCAPLAVTGQVVDRLRAWIAEQAAVSTQAGGLAPDPSKGEPLQSFP